MTSVFNGATKVNAGDIGYYINVGHLLNRINGVTLNSDGVTYNVSTATWAASSIGAGAVLGYLSTPGQAVLKDMGKTVVSSLRTFRKVQVVFADRAATGSAGGATSSFGVNGTQGTAYPGQNDYLTGYIELGFEGNGTPALVARYGR
jgi:hypothetical protein